ncbi:uncharacterized protein [Nicotiana sylvestris]|uniref:uncharacterized protein n=1 Tax=Nicotiana sylvestris TaxID=4096 RepID=UPI00388C59C8
MRAKTDPSFCEYLMLIGNGKEKTNMDNKIEISRSFIVPYITEKESLDLLFNIIYPNLHMSLRNSSFLTSHVILTTKNDFVDEINERLIAQFPKEAKTFIAMDETVEPNDQSQFEDFLHSLNPAGILKRSSKVKCFHKLVLKEKAGRRPSTSLLADRGQFGLSTTSVLEVKSGALLGILQFHICSIKVMVESFLIL